MKRKRYKVYWGQLGKPTIASVDFTAGSNAMAIRKADKIGTQLGVTATVEERVQAGIDWLDANVPGLQTA